MSERKNMMALTFPALFAVSFYDGEKIPTEEGYVQKPVDEQDLTWAWYIRLCDGKCVRAIFLVRSLRVLATPIVKAAPGMADIDAGEMLVVDETHIWTEHPDVFSKEHVLAEYARDVCVECGASGIPRGSEVQSYNQAPVHGAR